MEVATALLAASRRLSSDEKRVESGQSTEAAWNSEVSGVGWISSSIEVVRWY